MIRLPLVSLAVSILVTQTLLAFERPVISIQYPIALTPAGLPEKYGSLSDLQVMGTIMPPMEVQVRVRIFHILDDGKLERMAGVIAPSRDGRIEIHLDAPPDGWKIGQMRVEVALDLMPHVKSSVDITIAPQEIGIRGAVIPPPTDSGVVLDLEKCRGTIARIPANKLFLFRGQFKCEGIDSEFEGPQVIVSLQKEPIDGKGKASYHSGTTLSLREGKKLPTFGYEMQIRSPSKPMVLGVRATPMIGKWTDELNREQPDFFIEVTEPEK
jgi:hypothetical protein